MGFFKKVGDSFALNIIRDNTGQQVTIIDKGVCQILQLGIQGVLAKSQEGAFWVARANQAFPTPLCLEIDTTRVERAEGYPENCFTAQVRTRSEAKVGGITVGRFETGPWMTSGTLVARTPNVQQMLTEWSNNSTGG